MQQPFLLSSQIVKGLELVYTHKSWKSHDGEVEVAYSKSQNGWMCDWIDDEYDCEDYPEFYSYYPTRKEAFLVAREVYLQVTGKHMEVYPIKMSSIRIFSKEGIPLALCGLQKRWQVQIKYGFPKTQQLWQPYGIKYFDTKQKAVEFFLETILTQNCIENNWLEKLLD